MRDISQARAKLFQVTSRVLRRSAFPIFLMCAVSVVLSCSAGFSGMAAGSGAVVSLLAAPKRYEYAKGQTFSRGDVKVYALFEDGRAEEVPQRGIRYFMDYKITDKQTEITDTPYIFNLTGSHFVGLEYGGQSAAYTVIVREYTDGMDPTTPPGGGIGIGITWPD